LSPVLFIIVMTVLLHDASENLGDGTKLAHARGELGELVYADDTLIYGSSDEHVTEYLKAIQVAGLRYGLDLHVKTLQLLSTDSRARVLSMDGEQIEQKQLMEYLGALFHD